MPRHHFSCLALGIFRWLNDITYKHCTANQITQCNSHKRVVFKQLTIMLVGRHWPLLMVYFRWDINRVSVYYWCSSSQVFHWTLDSYIDIFTSNYFMFHRNYLLDKFYQDKKHVHLHICCIQSMTFAFVVQSLSYVLSVFVFSLQAMLVAFFFPTGKFLETWYMYSLFGNLFTWQNDWGELLIFALYCSGWLAPQSVAGFVRWYPALVYCYVSWRTPTWLPI